MAAKTQYVELYVRMRTLDEFGNDLHLPFEVKKQITVEQHRVQDYRVQENGAAFAVVATGAITDSITTPAVVLLSADKPIDLTAITGSALGTAIRAKLIVAANWDADDVGADCQWDSFDANNPAAADSNNNDANLVVYSSGDN